LDEGKVIYRKPVVPRRDTTTLFDPIEEPSTRLRACCNKSGSIPRPAEPARRGAGRSDTRLRQVHRRLR